MINWNSADEVLVINDSTLFRFDGVGRLQAHSLQLSGRNARAVRGRAARVGSHAHRKLPRRLSPDNNGNTVVEIALHN